MLTETAIRSAKPRERPYKLFDERGLYLLMAPTGGRLWRFRYRHGGKEKLLALFLSNRHRIGRVHLQRCAAKV